MKTPILLITFNRPDYVRRVLESVRFYCPDHLFIFQDGPRLGNEEDTERCAEVRKMVQEMIDWPCEVETLYSQVNLGCGPGPASALSWFFENVEEGIVLEDDAVPHIDFFYYASELLEKYRYDNNVRAIGSMNVDTRKWGDGSYYFSMMNRNLCAWASWRRAWQAFDINMIDTSRCKLRKSLKYYHCGISERDYWCDRLDEVHKDGVHGSSWDMQFFMSIWINHGKGIIPNVNLSSNIGTVDDATHALKEGNIIDNVPTHPILPLVHPSSEEIQYKADKEFHFRYFQRGRQTWSKWMELKSSISRRLKKYQERGKPWKSR